MKNVPPPGSKRIGDWEGKTVRIRNEMKNGVGVIPAGTVCKVESVGGGTGLQLRLPQCPCCGVAFFITRVHGSQLELVNEAA